MVIFWFIGRGVEGGRKVLDVKRGACNGYFETSCLMDLSCKSKKRYEMAMSHKREHHYLFNRFRRH